MESGRGRGGFGQNNSFNNNNNNNSFNNSNEVTTTTTTTTEAVEVEEGVVGVVAEVAAVVAVVAVVGAVARGMATSRPVPNNLTAVPPRKQNGVVRCLQWIEQNNQLFTGGSDNMVTIWSIGANKQFTQSGQVQAMGDVWAMKIVGPFLFAGVQVQQPQKCGLIQVWNMSNGKEYKLLKNNGPSHADGVYALEANATSGILFSGGGGMHLNAPQSDPFIRPGK